MCVCVCVCIYIYIDIYIIYIYIIFICIYVYMYIYNCATGFINWLKIKKEPVQVTLIKNNNKRGIT